LWDFRNSGEMDLYGIELQLDTKPTPRTDLHLAWSMTDPNGERLRYDEAGVLTYASLDDRVPKHTFGALLRQRLGHGWDVSASWFYVGKMIWGGEGDDPGPINRVDAKLSRSLRLLGSEVKLQLLVQNLFNEGYYDFYLPQTYRAGNLFDRRIYGQLMIRH
jgi:outer membrane receptor protein involved in Fe transport